MKKARTLVLLLCLGSLYPLLRAQQFRYSKDVINYSGRETHNRDSIRGLLKSSQYDAALAYGVWAREHNGLQYDDLELVRAIVSLKKGARERAYQYILNHADYTLRYTGGGGNPYLLLYDYSFGPDLATDTFLQQVVGNKVAAYYETLDYYPERKAGLKLQQFQAQWVQEQQAHDYRLQQCPDQACKRTENERHMQVNEAWHTAFGHWLRDNGRLLYSREAGPATDLQYTFIREIPQLEDHRLFAPWIRKAMEDKEIPPETYIKEQLVIARMEGADSTGLANLEDSLCRQYRCHSWQSNGKRMIRLYSQGDSVVYIDGDSLFRSHRDSMIFRDEAGRKIWIQSPPAAEPR